MLSFVQMYIFLQNIDHFLLKETCVAALELMVDNLDHLK